LTLVPASLEAPGQPASRPSHRYRQPTVPTSTPDLPADWWPESTAPLVYVTFGSVAAGLGFFPDFYRAMLTALADLPVRVLLTLGEAGSPSSWNPFRRTSISSAGGRRSRCCRATRPWSPHGRFTTALLGLSTGLPMVVVPLFALDQYVTARRIQAVGVGICLEDGAAAPARVRSALEQVLNDGAYRIAARRVADEIDHLPHPSECVAILEALVKHEAWGTTAVVNA
jgi:UDP:flavonoid glycosyltransferase YjiC (YdhE family)